MNYTYLLCNYILVYIKCSCCKIYYKIFMNYILNIAYYDFLSFCLFFNYIWIWHHTSGGSILWKNVGRKTGDYETQITFFVLNLILTFKQICYKPETHDRRLQLKQWVILKMTTPLWCADVLHKTKCISRWSIFLNIYVWSIKSISNVKIIVNIFDIKYLK